VLKGELCHEGVRGRLGQRRRGRLAEGGMVASCLGRVETVEDLRAIEGGADELVV
jgi:hypothetical protein